MEASPRFQWSPLNGAAAIECKFDTVDPNYVIEWLKNDDVIRPNLRTIINNNGTRIQLSELVRSDTGAYACRVRNRDETASNQDVASLLVQNEPISSSSSRKEKQKLWLFHGNGISVYSEGCGGLLHEINGRDVIPLNGQPLCGRSHNDVRLCEWGPKAIQISNKIYISQPNLNRIVVFHAKQLTVVQLIGTDPQPRDLWLIRTANEARIWVLCHGAPFEDDKKAVDRDMKQRDGNSLYDEMISDPEYQWTSPSKEQQRHNRKTVQVVRISEENRAQNVIHLQPIDGHFDLVYDLFVPQPSPLQRQHFYSNSRFAYTSHWDERTIVKIDMDQFKYVKTVNLAECQPVTAVFTDYGFLIIQCQTPVTHELNGQLILDQMTDSIISFNPHIKGHQSFLSPNQRFLVNIYQNESGSGIVSTTIIVQEVTKEGSKAFTA